MAEISPIQKRMAKIAVEAREDRERARLREQREREALARRVPEELRTRPL